MCIVNRLIYIVAFNILGVIHVVIGGLLFNMSKEGQAKTLKYLQLIIFLFEGRSY
jgi:hypothetical protein